MGNLHDFLYPSSNHAFFLLFRDGGSVPNHPPLRVDLSFYHFCQSDALRYAYLCFLIDHYGVLWLDVLLFDGWTVLSVGHHYAKGPVEYPFN
jgi:hypothetical protein